MDSWRAGKRCTIPDPAPGTLSAEPNLTAAPAAAAGMSHLTLGGHQHFGNRKIEMWYETLAPGAGTPIHSTSSEVIFYFLDGEVTLTTRARDGSLVVHEMLQNTTTTVLPNARHQLVNPGPGDASYILAFDTPPMGPILSYETWNAPRGKPMGPLPWDTACPGPPPPPPPPIDLDELNAQLRRGEL